AQTVVYAVQPGRNTNFHTPGLPSDPLLSKKERQMDFGSPPFSPLQETLLDSYHGHSQRVTALTWSPDGRTIASSGDNHEVQVWRFR
ncbi:MAG TPA: WD40 repeat domain-containing protein, partial [Ktedonobacteraceae bacterium]|nr:WD40 repeat domain-containing protein [Ktedonobacteraceae bacterium]